MVLDGGAMRWVRAALASAVLGWVSIVPLDATGQGAASEGHMTIANPADLDGPRAETIYQAIRRALRDAYARSEDPVAIEYQAWERYTRVP